MTLTLLCSAPWLAHSSLCLLRVPCMRPTAWQVSTTAAASLLYPPESVWAAYNTNYCVQNAPSVPLKPTAAAEDVRECEAQLSKCDPTPPHPPLVPLRPMW